MSAPTVEFLAMELKKIVGWGATPERLAMLPNLRVFIGLPPKATSVRPREDGIRILDRLERDVKVMSGPYEFYGKVVSGEDMRMAARVLLKLSGRGIGQGAEDRRRRAMGHLGLSYSDSAWRHAPEMELCRLIARHLLGEPGSQIRAAS